MRIFNVMRKYWIFICSTAIRNTSIQLLTSHLRKRIILFKDIFFASQTIFFLYTSRFYFFFGRIYEENIDYRQCFYSIFNPNEICSYEQYPFTYQYGKIYWKLVLSSCKTENNEKCSPSPLSKHIINKCHYSFDQYFPTKCKSVFIWFSKKKLIWISILFQRIFEFY